MLQESNARAASRLDAIHVRYLVERYYETLCRYLTDRRHRETGGVYRSRNDGQAPDVHDAAMLAIFEAARLGHANDRHRELWSYLKRRAWQTLRWLDGLGVRERFLEAEHARYRFESTGPWYGHKAAHERRPRWQRELAEDVFMLAERGDLGALYAVLDALDKDTVRDVLVGVRQKGIPLEYTPSERTGQRATRRWQFTARHDAFVGNLRKLLDDRLWNVALQATQEAVDEESAADRKRRLARERKQRQRGGTTGNRGGVRPRSGPKPKTAP
jgi:hypothetical protein